MDQPHDRPRAPEPSDAGSEWLYWEPKTRKWWRVELAEVPSAGPKRVRIQHLDAEQQGRAEWVPTTRIRVPWADRAAYLAREARWDRVRAHRPDPTERDAAWDVLAAVVPPSVADLEGGGGNGVLEVHDLAMLASAAGHSGESLTGHADALYEDGVWYLPWSCTRDLAAKLARRHSAAVLTFVVQERRERRARALRELADAPHTWRPANERAAELDEALYADAVLYDPRHAIIRFWASEGDTTLAEQYEILRRAFDALSAASIAAVSELRVGRTKRAERIATQLEDAAHAPDIM